MGIYSVVLERAALAESRTLHELPGFNRTVSECQGKIFRFALASLRDPDAAATITQDCFLKAHRSWNAFRNECSREAWLMKIALNLIRDYSRNRRLQFWRRAQTTAVPQEMITGVIDPRERSPEARALLKERVEAVWSAAADLPERQRTVFLLRFVEEMDILDIVASTGMKEGTVKTHLFRALQSVRERMGAEV